MKILRIICFLFLNAVALSQTITVLNKGDTLIAPDLTVIMDKYTFGKYAYTADKYDTLKQKIMGYDSIMVTRDSIQENIISGYKDLLIQKEKENEVLKDGFENTKATLQTSIDKNSQLQLEYKKLEHKNRRLKRWRNLFMGTTALSTGILILIIAI